jgi:hypothetical protein
MLKQSGVNGHAGKDKNYELQFCKLTILQQYFALQ